MTSKRSSDGSHRHGSTTADPASPVRIEFFAPYGSTACAASVAKVSVTPPSPPPPPAPVPSPKAPPGPVIRRNAKTR